jgi:predicted amidohydrolase YtcJ
VPLAFGSDAPVTELGPWAAVRAAVQPSDADAGISPTAALAAHTRGGWRAAGRDGEGVLFPGAPATFALWAADPGLPQLSPEAALPTCLATVRRGRTIFDRGVLS